MNTLEHACQNLYQVLRQGAYLDELHQAYKQLSTALRPSLEEHLIQCKNLEPSAFMLECLLCRFDLLTPYKSLLKQCYDLMWEHPVTAPVHTLSLARSFEHLSQLHPEHNSAPPALWALEMSICYTSTLPFWHADTSTDQTHTLDALVSITQKVRTLSSFITKKAS